MKSLTIERLEKTNFDPYANRQVTAIRDISLTVDGRARARPSRKPKR